MNALESMLDALEEDIVECTTGCCPREGCQIGVLRIRSDELNSELA